MESLARSARIEAVEEAHRAVRAARGAAVSLDHPHRR
jgi:hypothetical protein